MDGGCTTVAVGVGTMSSDSTSSKRGVLLFAADGCLLTAGTFAAMLGAAFGLEALGVAPLGEPQGVGSGLVLSIVSWLLQVGGFVVGPLLAWWLHRRRFGKSAILAFLIGFPIGGAVVLPAAMLGAAVDWIVLRFTGAEFAGAIAYLVMVLVAFLAVTGWLLVDAFRDLSPARRTHVPLDVGRLVAALAVGVFAAVVTGMMIAGEDALEAGVFVLAAGVQGAAVTAAASVISHLIEGRAEQQPDGAAL